MKINLIIAAATSLMATAALAQSAGMTAPGPSQSTAQQPDSGGMSPPSVTSPNGNLSGGDYSSSKTGSGTDSSSDMQLRDGKWMKGDRPATRSEISDYKAMTKANKSKPM